MGFGISIFTITLGAILKFAIHADTDPVDINLIGVILMIVGGASFVLQMVFAKQLNEGPPRSGGNGSLRINRDDD
ncbi:hypothetical protein GCM10027589_08020 [Actinocorallia lasiicapitis]